METFKTVSVHVHILPELNAITVLKTLSTRVSSCSIVDRLGHVIKTTFFTHKKRGEIILLQLCFFSDPTSLIQSRQTTEDRFESL